MGLTAADSWLEIVSAEIAAGAPITQELLRKLVVRDKALCGHPIGGRWALQSANYLTDKLMFRVFTPRSASGMFVEMTSGITGSSNVPQMRLYITDGTTTSYGAYLAMKDATGSPLSYPRRLEFPYVPIPAALRNKNVDCYFDGDDTTTATTFYGSNVPTDATAGYGVRFG